MAENLIVLSTGVELEIFKPAILAIREVERQINAQKPKPPSIYREDKETNEENPEDPDYINNIQTWQAEALERQFNIALITGTKIHSIPDGIAKFESEEWHGLLSVINVELEKSKEQRYIQWAKYVAAPELKDFFMIIGRVMSLIGVREEEVAEAVEAFRGDAERRVNNLTTINGDNTNGNTIPASNRRRSAPVRGVGRNGKT